MSQIASWAFLGLAVAHLMLPHLPITKRATQLVSPENRAAAARNIFLCALTYAVIAGVLRMP